MACAVRSSASWKWPPRTHASASTGSSRMSCNFEECSRTRAARRRDDWMEVISEEKVLAADSNTGMSSRRVSRVLENVESVEVRPVVVE